MNKRNYSWYNNSIIEKKCPSCPEGWVKGRLPASDITKEKNRNSQIKRYSNKEERLKTGKIMKEYYLNHPEKVKEIQEKLLEKYKSNELRKKIGKKVKEFFSSNPEVIKKLSIINSKNRKKFFENEDNHIKARESQLKFLLEHPDFKKNPEITKKRRETLKKNNTNTKSKQEDYVYDLLCKKFGNNNVLRNYYSELYPFNCDFYIIDLDMYIEYQGFQSHGKEPYDSEKKEHKMIVEEWYKRSNEINYKGEQKLQYLDYIKTWTERDVKKRKIAKQNNLNYIELWNIKEVEQWIKEFKYGI